MDKKAGGKDRIVVMGPELQKLSSLSLVWGGIVMLFPLRGSKQRFSLLDVANTYRITSQHNFIWKTGSGNDVKTAEKMAPFMRYFKLL